MDKLRIENAVREILYAIGEDPQREGLLETPARVANMYEEIFAGLEKNPADEVKVFTEDCAHEIIFVKDIPVYSMCEHHLLPFFGKASVAYIPSGNQVLGLSKVARIVDTVAKKPQLQERLCYEVALTIQNALPVDGVLVIMEAEHTCMTMRGIKKTGSGTLTMACEGVFKTDAAKRQEALLLLK